MQKDKTARKVLIINNGSFYNDKIISILQKHSCIVDEANWDSLQTNRLDYDLLVLSGGHQVPVQDHELEYADEITAIRNSNIPIIGICLGFELLAKTFGAELKFMPKNEKCELEITKLVDDPIFSGIDKLVVYENHHWKVDMVGGDLKPLAKSRDGIEIVKHRHRLIYGFQFHPEESEEDSCGTKLFENIFTLMRIR